MTASQRSKACRGDCGCGHCGSVHCTCACPDVELVPPGNRAGLSMIAVRLGDYHGFLADAIRKLTTYRGAAENAQSRDKGIE